MKEFHFFFSMKDTIFLEDSREGEGLSYFKNQSIKLRMILSPVCPLLSFIASPFFPLRKNDLINQSYNFVNEKIK